MYTQNLSAKRAHVFMFATLVCSLLFVFLVWKPFIIPKDEAAGKQLELPFTDVEEGTQPESAGTKVTPYPYNRRYDEERLGTCIIYGFKAPTDAIYKIPGCYGKPTSWVAVSESAIMKIGRHWNPSLKGGCSSTGSLEALVRKKRYGHDKKFPLGRIMGKVDGDLINIPMDIVILDCVEQVTEASCEDLEKVYIENYGGAQNLPLNCCCR